MLLDKFQYLLGDTGVGTDVAAIHLPIAQLFHRCILGWHDANSDLRRLAEVRTIECNRRNRPTPQSLPGFLAQALEEPIFHHIAPSATLPAGGEQRRRHREAERLRGIQIDDELELGRLYDWQISRLFSLENTPCVDAYLTIGLRQAGSVTH